MSDPPILEARNLEKYFKSRTSIIDRILGDEQFVHAVDDVSLKLNKKDTKAVIGESGCGKSTLLKTLVGRNKPTEGELLFKGQDNSTFGKEE
jgi:peptide/nickel transport system ATP-binding protein